MRTLLLFFLTCIIGSGAFLVATTMHHPLPAYIVGFGVWLLFLYRFVKKMR